MIRDLVFERQVRRLHDAGPRPLAELLREIGDTPERAARVRCILDRFTRIEPRIYHALGASDFPEIPLRAVGGR